MDQTKPIAFSALCLAVYLLLLQVEQHLRMYLIPSLPVDDFLLTMLNHHALLPQGLYLVSLTALSLVSGPAPEANRKKRAHVSRVLLLPVVILFIRAAELRSAVFIWVYPFSAVFLAWISSGLRLGQLFTKPDPFGIQNPGSWIETEAGFNWKTNTGYINVVNPFQGILIVGGAGSGKTYTLIEEIIRQAISKGYTGFIYDYKYPELSAFTFDSIRLLGKPGYTYYHLNFMDMERTHRINPLHPDNLPISAFAAEYAAVILKNLKREWVNHSDFWSDNAIAYLKAIIWYLKKHEPQYCSLPHVIRLSLAEYPLVLDLLRRDPECRSMISSLLTAYTENATAQIAGCVSSLQTPMDKLNSALIFWVLSGNDSDLNLNNPRKPAILTIGNNPQLQETISPVISLVASVVIKKMNQKNKVKSVFLLDEAPTLFIPDLKNLPNTGRSNQVCTVYCCQDFSQMNLLYGAEEAKAIRASLGNQFIGMVNDVETAEMVSRMFGQMEKQVKTINSSTGSNGGNDVNYSAGYSMQEQEKPLIRASEVLTLETGVFIGKTTQVKHAFFRGRPVIRPKGAPAGLPKFKDLGLQTLPDPGTARASLNSASVTLSMYGESMLSREEQMERILELNFKKIANEADEILFGLKKGS